MSADSSASELEKMWSAHRAFLRRLLISMARDIDLAEDLLQDTYIRARTGFSGYHGGDPRAWLSAIARSAFLTHARRKSYCHERYELTDQQADQGIAPGSRDHLDALSIRRAISDLDPRLRTALILKHYAGLTYDEIAAETGCPAGTAKWRVNQAVAELRSVLGISAASPATPSAVCERMRVLEYLYACLAPDESAEVEAHIRTCPHCRSMADEVRSVLTSLDHIEGDRKMMHIVEISRQGLARLYVTFSAINESDKPCPVTSFYTNKRVRLLHWIAQGEELRYERARNTDDPKRTDFRAPLREPVQPGERIEHLAVLGISRDEACAVPHQDGFRFEWAQRPSPEDEYAYVQAIRLPRRSELTRAEPDPYEIRTRGANTTVVWRKVLAPDERFSCAVEYSLKRR